MGVHFDAVPSCEGDQGLRLGLGTAAERDQFGELPLKAGWGDDLEESRGLVGCVPECVPLVARLRFHV